MDPVEKHYDHYEERAPPKESHRQMSVTSALVLGLETVWLIVLILPTALLSTLWKLVPSKEKSLKDQVVLVRRVTLIFLDVIIAQIIPISNVDYIKL